MSHSDLDIDRQNAERQTTMISYDQLTAMLKRVNTNFNLWNYRLELTAYEHTAPERARHYQAMRQLIWSYSVRAYGIDATSVLFGITRSPWVSRHHGTGYDYPRFSEGKTQ